MPENKDESTLISIVPFPIEEFKPGLYPGKFFIPPCNSEEPEFLVISTSVFYVPMPDDRPPLIVRTPSSEVARSIVEDYLQAQMEAGPDCHPGLTWLYGRKTFHDLTKEHAPLLNSLKKKQLLWFTKIVEVADTDWNRYHSHRVISDFQRTAAKLMGIEKEWIVKPMEEYQVTKDCPSCGTPNKVGLAVCPSCRLILDEEKYKKFKFASV